MAGGLGFLPNYPPRLPSAEMHQTKLEAPTIRRDP